MSSWARQRRFFYGGTVIVVFLALAAILAWKLFYKAPTCFDGVKNGREQGVDCGGACQKLCASAFLAPADNWVRFEEAAPNLYNVAAYVVNPNANAEAFGVPYHVELYDNKGVLIAAYDSTMTLPPNRNSLAFKAAVNANGKIPAKASFQFTGTPDWHIAKDKLANLQILDKNYAADPDISSLTVTLKNNGVETLGRLSVYAILYGYDKNVVGFSKTVIDSIGAGETKVAPFTWNRSIEGQVVSNEVLLVAE